ncbi:cytochrome P450 [Laetiporus sulphureus 93-53]|uniref:Cytochrome P450 n=1 Tax=Laetiporus sulphureus 93-53 TaxID=1314785 RepID=A0A165APS9_9APHY|nr:cytochrome P450 [Laetiporus sulphureus 93-53]KZS99422.1 cytochrome P450 [Laetiporus sulphureus 93-53]
MDPAFSTAQIRSFLPLFRRSAQKLSRKWLATLQSITKDSDKVINVSPWFARTTLDVIGEAAFDFQCGALDDEMNEVMLVYKDMFRDSVMHPSKGTLLFRSVWPYIPEKLLRYAVYIPTTENKRLRDSLKTINSLSRRLINEKTEKLLHSEDKRRKDIMSILVRANTSEDPRAQLTDREMIAQMATFLLAGHETSARALTWILWELAKHPEFQSKIREETAVIRAELSASGATDFSVAQLDSLVHLNAAIKEGLRLHPIVYMLVRVAQEDDIIPLSEPITSTTNQLITEIPVSKGQKVTFSVWGYNRRVFMFGRIAVSLTINRLPQVWGEDADEWNPSRFVDTKNNRQYSIGMFADMMSFGAGPMGCLGWRFAILELQAILVELLERFEFGIPAETPDIQRVPAGVMLPMIRNKMQLGSQMPLQVTLV